MMNWTAAEMIVGRILLGGLFVFAGVLKIAAPAPFREHVAEYHIPGLLLPAVIALEIMGGAMIWFNWQVSWAALALGVFCIATAAIFHSNLSIKTERTLFVKDLAIAGGLLILAGG